MSKLQRLNLEFQNLEDEEKRAKNEKEKLIKSQKTIEIDMEREKNIIIDAQSNEKRLNEEKNNLIDTEKKYYDLEKKTLDDLQISSDELKKEQNNLEKISENFSISSHGKKFISYLKEINQNLEKVKIFLENNQDQEAKGRIDNILFSVKNEIEKLEPIVAEDSTKEITNLTSKMKIVQEKYAYALSKHETVKTETIKTIRKFKKTSRRSFKI